MIESGRLPHGRLRPLSSLAPYIEIILRYQPKDWNITSNDVKALVHENWQDGALEDRGSRWLDPQIQLVSDEHL